MVKSGTEEIPRLSIKKKFILLFINIDSEGGSVFQASVHPVFVI